MRDTRYLHEAPPASEGIIAGPIPCFDEGVRMPGTANDTQPRSTEVSAEKRAQLPADVEAEIEQSKEGEEESINLDIL